MVGAALDAHALDGPQFFRLVLSKQELAGAGAQRLQCILVLLSDGVLVD